MLPLPTGSVCRTYCGRTSGECVQDGASGGGWDIPV